MFSTLSQAFQATSFPKACRNATWFENLLPFDIPKLLQSPFRTIHFRNSHSSLLETKCPRQPLPQCP